MVMIQLVRQARTLLCLDRNIPVRDDFFFFLTVCLWGVIGWVYAALMTAVRLRL